MSTATFSAFPSISPDWMTDSAWEGKLKENRAALQSLLPTYLQELHATVFSRSEAVNAQALLLSGSTARAHRTAISDLDYHLIGPNIQVRGLSRELDLHVLDEAKLMTEIRAGDDFVQWSLRFGLVVFDQGIVRRAHRLIAIERPWPDAERKRNHASKSVDLARRFVDTGDVDGSLEQVRTALSLAARAYLLTVGEFPLSRAEMPDQLITHGRTAAAVALSSTIFEHLSLAELKEAVGCAESLLREAGNIDSELISQSARKVAGY